MIWVQFTNARAANNANQKAMKNIYNVENNLNLKTQNVGLLTKKLI